MSNYSSQMKVPIRPAPPPPVNQKLPVKSTSGWDAFGDGGWNKSVEPVQKKKPPPRPPPPKFGNKKALPSRPSQLIAGLFQRKNNLNASGKGNDGPVNKGVSEVSESRVSNGHLLIDFSSPPSSPTFTTRSSSDALSVNSFGSDGVTPCSNSSGNASNVESGFEDDFDLFSNSARKATENVYQPRDPWSPPPKGPEPKAPVNGKSWATFPSPKSSRKVPITAMPTIIRSKPEAHKAQTKTNNCDTRSSVNALADVFGSKVSAPIRSGFDEEDDEEEDDGWSSESPPMPTCPPPPPPAIFNDLLEEVKEVPITEADKPNGVALYDYPGEAAGDLSFKADDVIYLVRRIDENWFVGRGEDGREGTVPANFISIRVPPPGEEDVFVTALYSFRPETWDDLAFEEGAVIRVTRRIDQDWLYGECNGKCGQFPANFVDRVPDGLPPSGPHC